MTNRDVKELYDAFISLCDHIQNRTEGGCRDCPYSHICHGLAGRLFGECLERIKRTVKE